MVEWREQMMKDLQLKGITPNTQKKYLREVACLSNYFGKSPEELGEKEVKEYLLHLTSLSRCRYQQTSSAKPFPIP